MLDDHIHRIVISLRRLFAFLRGQSDGFTLVHGRGASDNPALDAIEALHAT
jgi:hypothetical protein